MSRLSRFFVEKAEKELGENESKRRQSIEQFKNCVFNFRDADGKRTVIVRGKEIEAANISSDEIIKLFLFYGTAVLFEEETQIAGVRLIILSDISFNCFKKYLKEIPKFLQFLMNVKFFPPRIKQIILINLPTFAIGVYNLILNVLSKKIKQRLILVKSLKDLQEEFMNLSQILTENFNDFNERYFINNEENLIKSYKKIEEVKIDFNKFKEFESVGSFRKFYID
ncbi:hypothetical protein PVAND_014171 [Polypedilum vanderplanki]|uniref:CRAL-TRIO domain-containing protein n=1 Tax=Polypedilum vanderplanki TaxID=319348 RepID=A0A9J6CTA1_POLVA|nr:hypothetical protein PVAND_014171 [Polypedilum vanderplanki]